MRAEIMGVSAEKIAEAATAALAAILYLPHVFNCSVVCDVAVKKCIKWIKDDDDEDDNDNDDDICNDNYGVKII